MVFALATGPALARSRSAVTPGEFGAGIHLGEPSGITGKYGMGRQLAIDFLGAYSLSNYFLLASDFMIHFPGVFGQKVPFVSELEPYVGVGGALALSNRAPLLGTSSGFGVGVRVPIGIEWVTPEIPVGIYLEVVPGIWIFPATTALIQGGLGARFYFGGSGSSRPTRYSNQQLSR